MKSIAPQAAAISLLLYITEITLIKNVEFLICNFFLTVVILLFLGFKPLKAAKNSWFAIIFLVLMTLFAYIANKSNGYEKYFVIFLKGFSSIIVISSFNQKFSFNKLMAGFGKIGLPEILVNIMFLTFRYFEVIAEELKSMEKALISKGFEKGKGFWDKNTMKVLGLTIGNLFLRSMERSERVYNAMLSRGYNGKLYFKEESINLFYSVLFTIVFTLPAAILLFLEKVL
ncbi:MAG: energy-coupling factor transporter transmembrane component T family protein [Thermovenabulum sp.]|uniref:energy-coupling factor transporter transmembrane component T family protein n=1 Tax=Thermovenabulum sp. TaxID=3100335 RepID=UPI003C7ED557